MQDYKQADAAAASAFALEVDMARVWWEKKKKRSSDNNNN